MSAEVLIVDDDNSLTETLKEIFDLENIACFCVSSQKQALLLAQRKRLSFVLTDMKLPDGSGLELCRKLKENNPNMPVYMMTGKILSETEKMTAVEKGVGKIISKPFMPAELISEIKKIINKG